MGKIMPKARISFTKELIRSFISISLISILSFSCGNQQNKNAILLADPERPDASFLEWSPNDETIIVTEISGNPPHSEIYLLNISTNEYELIVETQEGNGTTVADTWSPDGDQVLFSAARGGIEFDGGIWSLDVDVSEPPVYFTDGHSSAWSSTDMLAIQKNDLDKNYVSIFLYDPISGSERLIYSVSNKSIESLSWSGDGSRLAFAMKEQGSQVDKDIYVLEIVNNILVRLTNDKLNLHPAWSPVADMIAYTKKGRQISSDTLHIVESDGSCDVEIPNLVDVWDPTWSPDGKRIAFISGGAIYLIDLTTIFGEEFPAQGLLCP